MDEKIDRFSNNYDLDTDDLDYPDPSGTAARGPSNKKDDSAKMELYDWVQCIVAALLCGIFIFMFIGRVIGVDGSSMNPTLYNGDKIIVSNLFYHPEAGDIIVLQTNTFGEDPLVKRIIATEGQTIDIDFSTGEITIDGQVIHEDYIADLTHLQEDFSGPVTVPEGCVFVMGDNRNASTDSRSSNVGMVDTRCILGKVCFLIIPGADTGGSRDWSRIGSVY